MIPLFITLLTILFNLGMTIFFGSLIGANIFFFLTNLDKNKMSIPRIALLVLCVLGVAASALTLLILCSDSWGNDFITGPLTTQSPPQLPVVEGSVEEVVTTNVVPHVTIAVDGGTTPTITTGRDSATTEVESSGKSGLFLSLLTLFITLAVAALTEGVNQ